MKWLPTAMTAGGAFALFVCALVMHRPDLLLGVMLLLPVVLIFAVVAGLE